MSINLNKSGLGKFAGMRGTIFRSGIAAARPNKQIVGRDIGKDCDYPMDSDAEFEERLRRYECKKQAEEAAAAASVASTMEAWDMLNGKPVWKQDNFTHEAVKVGNYVEQAVVDAAMDCAPPVCMRADCSQMDEPYSARMGEKTGRWRDTYETFCKADGEWPNGIWEYCGHCFRGETVERGIEPHHI